MTILISIIHVVRLFKDGDVVHVAGECDPVADLETILTELMLADIEVLEKRRDRAFKTARSGDADAKFELELIRSFIDQLNAGQRPEWDKESPKAVEIVESLGLLCTKPAFVCANVGDDQVGEAFLADPDAKRLIGYQKL